MEIMTSIIDLDSIQIKKKFSEFEFDRILLLANSIVQLKGLLQIPIVRQLGIDSYELVSGFLEYQAYLKARELDPELPDRLRVFIINSKNEELILKQIEAFDKIEKVPTSPTSTYPVDLSISVDNLAFSVNHFRKEFQFKLEEIRSEMLAAIESKLPTPLSPLQAFNQIDNPRVAAMVAKNLAGVQKGKKIVERLQQIKEQNPNKEFKTFDELITALGKSYISKQKMLDVIDRWS